MKIYWDKVLVVFATLAAIGLVTKYGDSLPQDVKTTIVTALAGVLALLLPPHQKNPPKGFISFPPPADKPEDK